MGRRHQSDSDSEGDRKHRHRRRRSRSRDRSDSSSERSSSHRHKESRRRNDDKYRSSSNRSRRRSRSRSRESKRRHRRRSRSSDSSEGSSSKSRSRPSASDKRLSGKVSHLSSSRANESSGGDLKSRIAQLEINREVVKIDSPINVIHDESVLKSIAEDGFSQASFRSSGQKRSTDNSNQENAQENSSSALTAHEKAMFGQTASSEERFSSIFKRKTIERPLLSDGNELQSTSLMDVNVFGEDPEVRMQRWKEKLIYMRKQLNKPIHINLAT